MVEVRKKGIWGTIQKTWLLIPAVVVVFLFFVIPIVMTVVYSFTNLALTGANAKNFHFVGLQNYIFMFKDPDMYTSLKNTLIFLVGSLLGQQIMGFLIAYNMKNRNRIFRGIVGPIILAGWVMPEVVVALCIFALFDDGGTINNLISIFGVNPISWLYSFPMLSVIIGNVWHGTAFSMMMFQAALDDVPTEIEEAATVDGANNWQRLVHIIIPCISGTIATNTMLNTLQTLGVFGLIYAITGGGPGMSTNTLPIYMYNQAFVRYELGYGTAISMILLFIGVVLSVFYTRLMSPGSKGAR